MLIQSLQSKICEKIVRNKKGQLVKVCIEFKEIEGRVYGRIISAELIQCLKGKSVKNLSSISFLPLPKKENSYLTLDNFDTEIISPYYSFEFFTSQMTRAPAK